MIVCALLSQLVPPHVALKQSGEVDMDPFAPHQEAAQQQAPQQEVPQQGAPLPPLPQTQQEKHSQQAAQEQARHEQHELAQPAPLVGTFERGADAVGRARLHPLVHARSAGRVGNAAS